MARTTKLFNRSTQALVPDDVGYGEGVVMPGEFFKTKNPDGYCPDQPGSPWTVDDEAAEELDRLNKAQTAPKDQPAEPQDTIDPPEKAEGGIA